MTHSVFGWSYPPGCSGPPEYPEEAPPQCKHCAAFLPKTPDMLAPRTFVIEDFVSHEITGPHVMECKLENDPEFGAHYLVKYLDHDHCEVRRCRKCGRLDVFIDY